MYWNYIIIFIETKLQDTIDKIIKYPLGFMVNLARKIFKIVVLVVIIINSSTSFCLRSCNCRTHLSIHIQPSRQTTIWMFFFSYPYAVFSTFYSETDHRKCEMPLGGWHCGLRRFKLGRPLHTGFEPRSLAWLACSTDQSATTYTTVAWLCNVHIVSAWNIIRVFVVFLISLIDRMNSSTVNSTHKGCI